MLLLFLALSGRRRDVLRPQPTVDAAVARLSPTCRVHQPSLDRDLDVASAHAHLVTRNGIIRRGPENLSRPDVEPSTMPRADHFVARDFSLGQWPLLVRTSVAESEEVAVDVEQGNVCALHSHQQALARCNLIGACPFTNSAMDLFSCHGG